MRRADGVPYRLLEHVSTHGDPNASNLLSVANIINTSRITAVHAKEKIPVPSRDQAVMVIFATRDVVRRNLSSQKP
jgi:hypothetical protein